MAKMKEKRTGDQDFIVDPRLRHQKRTFLKCNATWDEKYFSERLEITRNLQNKFNMMSTRVSRKVSNQNDNVQRVGIRDMIYYIESLKDSQIDSDATF